MNKLLLSLLFVSSLLFSANAEWNVETVSTSGGQTSAISLDSSDVPRIVYGRPGQGAKFAEYNGTYWSTELIYESYYGDCEYFDIVTDENDISHVSFCWSGLIISAVQDPVFDSWNYVMPTGASGVWNSLGLSNENNPGISYYSYDQKLKYLYNTGSQWLTELVDAGSDVGNYNSILREGVNEVFIAYSMTQPTSGLKYANRDNSGIWHTAFVDTSMTSEPMGISLAHNGSDYPCISYRIPGELRYAEWDGSVWNVETIMSVAIEDTKDTGVNEYDTSLAIDQYDNPRLIHCNMEGDSLLYSWNDGTSWHTESLCLINGEGGGDSDLVLDSMGRPHVAFYTGVDLFYAFNDEILNLDQNNESVSEFLGFNSITNPFYGSLNLSFTLPVASFAELTVYDLQGREITNLLSENCIEGNNQFSWTPETSVPNGQYIIMLEVSGLTVSQKVVYLR